MMNRTDVFIVDDNLPKIPEFIELGAYQARLDQNRLTTLLDRGSWQGEFSLRKLIVDLLSHPYVRAGKLTISGYVQPQFCIADVSSGAANPDVIIYDWEYGSGSSWKQSAAWLIDLLNKTEAFIFVYSGVRDSVPEFLNKKEFDSHANRFQLFAKGNANNSVFTSEDFLYQYVLSRVNRDNTIKIQGTDVKFEANGYLKNPTDILQLESILGRTALLDQIAQSNNELSADSVERIVESLNGHLLLNAERGVLLSADSELLSERFKPHVEISYLEALKKYGLHKLKEAIEVGFAAV